MRFDETRYSALAIGIAVLLEIIAILLAVPFEKPHFYAIFSLVPLFFFLNSLSVRVAIDDEEILVRFGIGLFGSTIPIAAIENLEVVKAGFISWLYNPGQEDVLRIAMRFGEGSALVPLGDPRRLIEIISGRMGR